MILESFVKAVQDSTLLDRAADPVQPVLSGVFRSTSDPGRRIKNVLSGTWLGHPLHPILKDIPIGSWTMAALFDAVASDKAMQRAADISIVTGIAGALASAVTGLSDWSDTTGRPRRVGVAHALLNVTALGMYAASMTSRWSGHRPRGIALAYGGYAIMGLGGYLGGHLVFGEQIGVNHAALTELPEEFSGVLPENELLENQPRSVDYKGTPVVLVRQGSRIHALYERCSHMGGPLAEGTVENGTIRCPWHGSRFALEDGGVAEGPATNPQPCFETRVVDGVIQVRSRS